MILIIRQLKLIFKEEILSVLQSVGKVFVNVMLGISWIKIQYKICCYQMIQGKHIVYRIMTFNQSSVPQNNLFSLHDLIVFICYKKLPSKTS